MANKSFNSIIIVLVLGTVAAIAITIWSGNVQSSIEGFDDNIIKLIDDSNRKVDKELEIISNFYSLADTNLYSGMVFMDSVILNDFSFNSQDKMVFNWIVGEVLYDADSIDLALNRFGDSSLDVPRNLANIAGCLIKQGKLKEALPLLKKAAHINPNFRWYIGNFYEIMGNRDSAVFQYNLLLKLDYMNNEFYLSRIEEMTDLGYEPLQELMYLNRRKRTYIRMMNSNIITARS